MQLLQPYVGASVRPRVVARNNASLWKIIQASEMRRSERKQRLQRRRDGDQKHAQTVERVLAGDVVDEQPEWHRHVPETPVDTTKMVPWRPGWR